MLLLLPRHLRQEIDDQGATLWTLARPLKVQ